VRKVEIVEDNQAQRRWLAVDTKSRVRMLQMDNRELLWRICRSLEWKIVQPDARRRQGGRVAKYRTMQVGRERASAGFHA
jgi:hypothetical protein